MNSRDLAANLDRTNPLEPRDLDTLAAAIVAQLREREQKLVLAESCTAGLVCATLGRIPGVSAVLCGSSVTYREPTKTGWLGVSPELLADWTAESQAASDAMALGVLQRTPEAAWSVAVTGHLGPQAPPEADGALYLSASHGVSGTPLVFARHHLRLAPASRSARQIAATWSTLLFMHDLSLGMRA